MIQIDKAALAAVFEEWKARFDADPDSFYDCEAFKEEAPATYGEGAAIYFNWLLGEMG